MTIRYHKEAAEEYDRAVRYYAKISPDLAARLIDEVEKAIKQIELLPFAGSELRPQIRALIVRVFPYRIIYMIAGDIATVLAIAHAKREPEYWLKRAN